MRTIRLILLATAILLGSWRLRADSPADAAGQHQLLLEKWRQDPALFARLKRQLQSFLALPHERQQQMRQLDQALREAESGTSVRLQRVMERYAEWLERLPQSDRERVETAQDAKARLQIIREFREREWTEHLPRAIREELAKLPSDRRGTRIAELRKEERAFRDSWRAAIRHWDEIMRPRPQAVLLQQLEPQIRSFTVEHLIPVLSREERQRLKDAMGHYPLFWEILVELSERHIVHLPGPPKGPGRFSELPAVVQQQLAELKTRTPPILQRAEEKWPNYCLAIWNYANRHKIRLVQELGPSRPSEFPRDIQQFIEKKLVASLDPDEKKSLANVEGRWPEYPRMLAKLSSQHGLQVPGTSLPGPAQLWNSFRKRTGAPTDTESLPGVSDKVLLEFMRTDLSAQERANLPSLSLSDAATRAQLKQLYFQKRPNELQRLRQQDSRKQRNKGGQK
jgi:hypothetical protein